MKIASTHAEQHFLPLASLAELGELRRRLLERGYSRSKVAGCLDFLVAIEHGAELPEPSIRTQYRKMLHELVVGDGPRGASRARRASRATPGLLSSPRRPAAA